MSGLAEGSAASITILTGSRPSSPEAPSDPGASRPKVPPLQMPSSPVTQGTPHMQSPQTTPSQLHQTELNDGGEDNQVRAATVSEERRPSQSQLPPQTTIHTPIGMRSKLGSHESLTRNAPGSPLAYPSRRSTVISMVSNAPTISQVSYKSEENHPSNPTGLRNASIVDLALPHSKLEGLDTWTWSIFDKPADDIMLYTLHIFQDLGLLKMLQLTQGRFLSFLSDIRAGYHPNPYHNFEHGFDVMQTSYIFLKGMHAGEVLTSMNVMVLLLSAIGHDLDHPGVTNDFLIKAKDPLARIYNDRSVLENHHAATLFQIIDQHSLFAALTAAEYKEARKKIIDAILSTDMARHFTLCGDLQTFISGNDLEEFSKNRRQLQLTDDGRSFIVNVLLHSSDISNPAKPWEVSKKWSDMILEEFFRQGDLEKSMKLPLSPNMDPETTDQAIMSCNFIDFIIEPAFSTLKMLFPLTTECYQHLRKNRLRWDELKHETQLKTDAINRHHAQKQLVKTGGTLLGNTNVRFSAVAENSTEGLRDSIQPLGVTAEPQTTDDSNEALDEITQLPPTTVKTSTNEVRDRSMSLAPGEVQIPKSFRPPDRKWFRQSSRNRKRRPNADSESTLPDDNAPHVTASQRLLTASPKKLFWRKVLDNELLRAWMVFLTLIALYGRDVVVISSTSSADTAWAVVALVVIGTFLADIVVRSYAVPIYFNTFWFYADLLGTCAIIGDLPWLTDAYYQYVQLQVARAGGVAVAGAVVAGWINRIGMAMRQSRCLWLWYCCRRKRMQKLLERKKGSVDKTGRKVDDQGGIALDMFQFADDVETLEAKKAVMSWTGEQVMDAPPRSHSFPDADWPGPVMNIFGETLQAPVPTKYTNATTAVAAPMTDPTEDPDSFIQNHLRHIMPKTRTGEWVLELMSRRMVLFVVLMAVIFPAFMYPYYDETGVSRVQALQTLTMLPPDQSLISTASYAMSIPYLIDISINGSAPVVASSSSELRSWEIRSYRWSADESSGLVSVSRFSVREDARKQAGLFIGLTTVLVLFMFLSARLVRLDIRNTCVEPFERALALVLECTAFKFVSREAGEQAAAKLKASATEVPAAHAAAEESTSMLEGIERMSTLVTVGVGLGPAGKLVSASVNKQGKFVPAELGSRVDGVFGLCRMRRCNEIADAVQEQAVNLINSFTGLLHDSVISTEGFPVTVGHDTELVWLGEDLAVKSSRYSSATQISAVAVSVSGSTPTVASLGAADTAKPLSMHALMGHPKALNTADNAVEACAFVVEELMLFNDGRTSRWFESSSSTVLDTVRRKYHQLGLQACFILHTGWAVQGCVGSRRRAGAAFLGQHYVVPRQLLDFAAEHGCDILLTGDMVKQLSRQYRDMCRRVDRVKLANMPHPLDLFAWDPYTYELGVDLRKAFGGMVAETGGGHSAIKHYRALFEQATGAYLQSNWPKAAEILELCVKSCPHDGPAIYLLSYLEKHSRTVPADWPGHRVL